MIIFSEAEQDSLESYLSHIRPHESYAPTCLEAFIEAYCVVYDNDGVGGNVHVVLDDWNLSRDTLDWAVKCLDSEEVRIPVIRAERDVLHMLQSMTIVERYYALHVASQAYSDREQVARRRTERRDIRNKAEARRKAGWRRHD